MSDERLILVTGASGYVGGRLVTSLLANRAKVRVFVRDANKAQSHTWANEVEIAVGNATDYQSTVKALTGVHTAFYLLHSINLGPNFDQIESEMARNFAKAAEQCGVKQIVYLGGINNDSKTSKHLQSRANTGKELATTSVAVMELRAGIIIGSGSASFEMLRHLTHRLPVMTTPKWVSNKTHPIAIRDILWFLRNAAKLEKPVTGIFDIGGPEILSYAEMMQKFAKISGLRRRWIIEIPVLTPKLSSLWIGFVTPVPTSLARPLVGSLISEVVADPAKSISHLIPNPPEGLIDVEAAIHLALTKVSDNNVLTRWSDAAVPTAPWQKAQSDPAWAGETLYKDTRVRITDASIGSLWEAVEEIGGETGWYGSDFLWYMRGLIDRMIGGVGLRRGRRDPLHLRVGDSLDFWRVESLQNQTSLKLYAEMILPGKAWLEFRIRKLANGKSEVIQEASFLPRGLGGRLYWYVILPLHTFVFPTMIRNLIRSANRKDYAALNA
ncbi:MAG: SDR family oxidoreductase [Actinobacteria bacterium]|nr:SDR family oxidoreductase [Actinomycetota bacterium]